MNEKDPKLLQDYTRIIVETDEKHPKTIAIVTADDFELADGFRVRMTPNYKN